MSLLKLDIKRDMQQTKQSEFYSKDKLNEAFLASQAQDSRSLFNISQISDILPNQHFQMDTPPNFVKNTEYPFHSDSGLLSLNKSSVTKPGRIVRSIKPIIEKDEEQLQCVRLLLRQPSSSSSEIPNKN